MGISVVLQDERCDDISGAVHDPDGAIVQSLPDGTDATYCCVRFIDPYGDTVFNPLQARVLALEWDRLRPSFATRNAEALWAEVRALIVRCSEETHTYIRFIGD